MQFLVKRQEIHVVSKVQYLLGELIVRSPVCAVSVRVVLPSILNTMVKNG
jgi:hypothetical protein